jgi:hypothetical protein
MLLGSLGVLRKPSGGRLSPLDYVSDQDAGGQVGLKITASSSNQGSVWTANGLYDAISGPEDSSPNYVDMLDPSGNGIGVLFAPTTKSLNEGCIEYGTQYDSEGPGVPDPTEARFFFVDWCSYNPATQALTFYYTAIDSNFWSTYVRTYSNGDGYPQYVAEALKYNNVWYMLLYNNNTQQYVTLSPTLSGTDQGSGAGNGGWSLFETHYNAGVQCANLPTLSVSGVRVMTNDGTWGYAGSSGFGPVAAPGQTPECFQYQSTPYYDVRYNSSDEGWWVDSNQAPTADYRVTASSDGPPSGAACTPDSAGYCYTTGTTTDLSVACSYTIPNPHGGTEIVDIYNTRTAYNIYQKQSYAVAIIENAYKTVEYSTGCKSSSTTWSPAEPRVQYSDPNLP